VILAALALLAAQNQSGPWEEYQRPPPCEPATMRCTPYDRFSTPAAPPGWEYMTYSTSGTLYYIHRDTLRSSYAQYTGTQITVWVRMDHYRDRSVHARMSRGMLAINCGSRSYSWSDLTFFGPNDRQIGSTIRDAGYANIAPDTVMFVMWARLCPASETRPSH
jgi:hypothetical protein